VNPDSRQPVDATDRADDIDTLLSELSGDDELARYRAVQRLVALGRAASPALARALTSGPDELRWRAALALAKIADPATTPNLLRALEDGDIGVRWLAAEALSAIGIPALVPLLEGLIDRADSVRFREGVTHVLLGHVGGPYAPAVRHVLRALDGQAAEVAAPVAAYEMLQRIPGKTPGAQSSPASSA
jgi:HEAT repeat protein